MRLTWCTKNILGGATMLGVVLPQARPSTAAQLAARAPLVPRASFPVAATRARSLCASTRCLDRPDDSSRGPRTDRNPFRPPPESNNKSDGSRPGYRTGFTKPNLQRAFAPPPGPTQPQFNFDRSFNSTRSSSGRPQRNPKFDRTFDPERSPSPFSGRPGKLGYKHNSNPNFDSSSNFKGGFRRGGPSGFRSKKLEPPDFGPLKLLTAAEVVERLQSALKDFSSNAYVHDSLAAYGLNQEVSKLLVSHLKMPRRVAHKEHRELRLLLDHWMEEMEDKLENARYSAEAMTKLSADGWDIEGLRTTMALENPLDVTDRRLSTQFLSWAQQGLHSLSVSKDAPENLKNTAFNAYVHIQQVLKVADLRSPMLQYPETRRLTREIHLHVGPTNSGKTHGALVRLMNARTGIYAGPLRLLAHEIWYRINAGQVSPGLGSRQCNLLTGDEVRSGQGFVGLTSCTVEMVPAESPLEVAVIDEIQMIADPWRGHAWTNALLGVAAKEVHLCGEASVVPLIQRIAKACGDKVHVHEYQRLTPLQVSDFSLQGDLSKISKGDCVVAFSRLGIFALKRKIEEQTGLQCAVVYGGLPPETRAEQARLFNDPDSGYDVMIASDAIGMGLNLKIKRVIFESLTKFDGGSGQKYLTASQIKQIAGRAGRYGVHADDTVGCAMVMEDKDVSVLKAAMDAPTQPITRAAFNFSNSALERLAEMIDTPDSPHVREPEAEAQDGDRKSPSKSPKTKLAGPTAEGAGRSLLALRKDARMLVRLDEQLYFHSNIAGQLHILSVIEKASMFRSPKDSAARTQARIEESDQKHKNLLVGADSGQTLSISERERLSDAPANTRDERVMYSLQMFTRTFSMGSLVEFEKAIEASDMLQTLERMETLEAEALKKAEAQAQKEQKEAEQAKADKEAEYNPLTDLPPSWKATHASDSTESQQFQPSALSYGRSRSAAHYVDPDAPEVHIDTLTVLESLHRTCGLYLWLSYRFPLSFCFGTDVERYKHRTEMMIQFTLEAIRVARAKRLQRLYQLRAATSAEEGQHASSDAQAQAERVTNEIAEPKEGIDELEASYAEAAADQQKPERSPTQNRARTPRAN